MTRSPSRTQNPLLAAALAYAARGWRVFPLHPRDKTPIPKSGFKEASSSEHEILRWWQLFPDANIGLATGEPFDALDIDSRDAVPDLQRLLGSDYRHAGPVVDTGKGWHLYFAATGAGNRAGLLGGKIDFRGTGGYVVAPPSIHPSGRIYRWREGRDYTLDLPLVPDVLRPVLEKPKAKVSDGAVAYSLPGGASRIAASSSALIAASREDIVGVAAALGCQIFVKGMNHVTNCIFHDDPGPSMVLYTGQNKFFCFGCEAHGDSRDLANKRDMTGRIAII